MATVLKGVEGVMKGYRPQVDWGGEEGQAMIKVGSRNVKVGTAGWRRRCLFILLSALLLLSVLNFVFTLWLLRNISFNAEGAGSLRVLIGGVNVEGTSNFDHKLTVFDIKSPQSEDLNVFGYYNISFAVLNVDETYVAGFVIDQSRMEAAAKKFLIKDSRGNLLFESREGNISTGAKFFIVTGDGGAIFSGSLETPRIQGSDVHEFRIESGTHSILAAAANELRIEARDGDAAVTSFGDVRMTSQRDKFRFESPNVFFSDLPDASEPISNPKHHFTTPATDTQIPSPEESIPTGEFSLLTENEETASRNVEEELEEEIKVFQVCVCPSGRLFLAASDSVCISDEFTCR